MTEQLSKQVVYAPELPFTEITGDHIGPANVRYEMMWGDIKLKRVKYSPYGDNNIPAIWHVGDTIISHLTVGKGNEIALFLEDKWLRETEGITIPLNDKRSTVDREFSKQ